MQCRLNQEKYLRKYSVKKHKEKPDRVYLAYKKADNNHIEKEKRKVANDYLTQTSYKNNLKKPTRYCIIYWLKWVFVQFTKFHKLHI